MIDDNQIQVERLNAGDDTGKLYHYTASGLNNYWLSPDLFERDEKRGKPVIIFPKLFEMHAAIAMHICNFERRLGPREIRYLRGELDWSQNDLGIALGYRDKQMVATAEKLGEDRKPLSNRADLLLRRLYLESAPEQNYAHHDYHQQALALGRSLNRPQPTEIDHWQLAA